MIITCRVDLVPKYTAARAPDSVAHLTNTHGAKLVLARNDYYVYVYIDPRDFKPFYYGKGRGSRSQAHLFDDGGSDKCRRIRAIVGENLKPLIRVIAHDLTEEQAHLVETTLIWQFKDLLTNKAQGKFIGKFRPSLSMYKELVGIDYSHRLWYFNVGDGSHRRWKDNVNYGYVGAGQGKVWRSAVEELNRGDVVAAYVSNYGYVGVGKIIGDPQPARAFRLKDGDLLIEKKDVAPKIKDNLRSLDYCEWMAPVNWIAAVEKKQAFFKKKAGLFASPLARASLDQQPATVKFIQRKFKIPDLFALTDADPSASEFH